jgi:RimJ/RimL family protein N-acetyltransferase
VSDGLIETERLLLRPLAMDDLAALVALHADPRVNRFVSAYTEDEARQGLTRIRRQWAERGHGMGPVTVYALNRPG